MSRHGTVREIWAGEERAFRLALGQLRELQEVCTLPADKLVSGPLATLRRLENGDWRVQDVIHTIRLGLVGGGISDREAVQLVKRQIEDLDQSLLEQVPLACKILLHSLSAMPGEPMGKSDAAEESAPTMEASPSPSLPPSRPDAQSE